MGHLDVRIRHGGGGDGPGLGLGVLILAGALLAGPLAALVAAVVHLVAVVLAVVVGLAVVAAAALAALRLRGPRRPRALPWTPGALAASAARPPAVRAGEIHLHFHGVTAADVPAIVAAARPAAPLPRPVAAERVDGSLWPG